MSAAVPVTVPEYVLFFGAAEVEVAADDGVDEVLGGGVAGPTVGSADDREVLYENSSARVPTVVRPQSAMRRAPRSNPAGGMRCFHHPKVSAWMRSVGVPAARSVRWTCSVQGVGPQT